ncbi:MAG TPA: thiamine biosynthesis protein ThiF [Streptosporangiaceae bacterium]|nr:thiamine biosynthesis protein ThiF [Streptosporangiaceae bacterium]
MRPALKAGLLPVWRDRETVQIGIDPRRAVALTGLGGAADVLRLLDGSRDREQVLAAARERGIPRPVTERILTLLAAGGVLDDVPAAALRSLPQEQRRRLAAELAGGSLARGHSDAGATALARRDAARVAIHGTGRVAAAIADLLVSSGVGRVTVGDRRPRRGRGRRAAPARDIRGRSADAPVPDLAILVGFAPVTAGPGRDLPGELMRSGVAHLAVRAEEAIGVVGPLVRPGLTACLRCLDLTRAGLDPAWPLILAQLAGRAPDPPACDAALATAVAAQAAAQALACLDRGYAAQPAENGTLELVPPGWQWRRRTWPRHPACECARRDDGRGNRQWEHE